MSEVCFSSMEEVAESVAAQLWLAIASFLAIVSTSFCWIYLRMIRQHKSRLENAKLAHPPLKMFSGNAEELIEKGPLKALQTWMQSYDKVFCVYYGTNQCIVMNDVEMIQKIALDHSKSFNCMTLCELVSNGSVMGADVCTLNMNCCLLLNKAGQPENLKSSPIVCGSNLDYMAMCYKVSCDQLLEEITDVARLKSTANITSIFNQFAVQSAMSLYLGKELKVLQGKTDELSISVMMLCRSIQATDFTPGYDLRNKLSILATHSSVFKYLSSKTDRGWKKYKEVFSLIKQIVLTRKLRHRVLKYEDLLDVILETHYDLNNSSLTQICVGTFLANYVFLSNILASVSYLLAINPQKQEKLIKRIAEFYSQNEQASLYDASQSIRYLDWVVLESIRLYSPNAWIHMLCTETVTFNSIEITEGSTVVLPIQALYRSPDLWKESNEFIPERFDDGWNSSAWKTCSPFASLPSNGAICGQLFQESTLIGIKMALVSTLMYFKFVRAQSTMVPLKTSTSTVFGNVQMSAISIELAIETN